MTTTSLQQLKKSHSPDMSDEDFIKMLAAANNTHMQRIAFIQ